MYSVSRELVINASKKDVWNTLADLGMVSDYSKNVEGSSYVTSNTSGVGAARKCDLGKAWVVETAIDWKEYQGYTLKVTDGKGLGPLKELIVVFELSESSQGTKVHQTMSYSFKGGILSPLINTFAVGNMRKAIEVNLKGLKDYVEHQSQTVN